METKSRLRGPNFTSSDSLLLCDILEKYKNVIENKKTDGANLAQKQKAWLNVLKEYNSATTGHHRTVESLQQNYKNLKKKAKKNASDAKMDIPVERETLLQNIEEYGTSSEGWEKVSASTGASQAKCQKLFGLMAKEAETSERNLKKKIMGTGGGPPPKFDGDPVLQKVKGLVGSTMEGLYTIYDGDSTLMEHQNLTPIEIEHVFNETPSKKDSLDTADVQSILQPTCSMSMTPKAHEDEGHDDAYFTSNRANLKKKPHHLLSRKRKLDLDVPQKQSVSTRFSHLASEKLELVAMQKELLKCQLLEEQEKLEHNRTLRAMELEDAKQCYAHKKLIRELELEAFNK